MMKPLKQPVPSKRIWTIVVGLGLVAGASALFWRPFVSAPDSAGDGATSEPAAEPTEEGVEPEPQYTSAAVLANAANRLQAMAYVEFRTSDEARAAFARQGFALP